MPVYEINQLYGQTQAIQELIRKYNIDTMYVENFFIYRNTDSWCMPIWTFYHEPDLIRETINHGNDTLIIYYHPEYKYRDDPERRKNFYKYV